MCDCLAVELQSMNFDYTSQSVHPFYGSYRCGMSGDVRYRCLPSFKSGASLLLHDFWVEYESNRAKHQGCQAQGASLNDVTVHFLHRITCSRDRSPFWRALPTSRSESSAETSAFLGLLGAGFTHISTYLQIYIYARVTLTLLDLLFQILLKTKLYLLETTFCILLLGHKYPQTIMFFWPLSLSLSCQADHRFDAAHCVPCGPNMKNCRDWRCFSSLNYPSIASMPTHFDTLLDSTKTKLSKSFYVLPQDVAWSW